MENTKTDSHQAPIKNYTEIPNNLLNNGKSLEKPIKNQDLSSPQVNYQYIREKRIYKRFLKEIKGKRAINGVVMADILGITRQTVYKWLDTPKAIAILQENTADLLSNISKSKDWKASAYLLDKLQGKQDITNIQVNTLDGLTIIRR